MVGSCNPVSGVSHFSTEQVACIPPLTVSCSPNPVSIAIGTATTWTATPSGGTGSYTYSWQGADGWTATGAAAVVHTYNNLGTWGANVVVTSGSQSVNQFCGNVLVHTAVPSAPILSLLGFTNTSVNLQWTFPSYTGGSPITAYNIYESSLPQNGSGSLLIQVPVNIQSYNVTGLSNLVNYYWQVKAVNAVGNSIYSNVLGANPH